MLLTKDDLIAINREIIGEWLEEHPEEFEAIGASRPLLEDILNETRRKDTPVLQASYMMAAIAWSQPFSGANKRTAIASASALLGDSGYDLDIDKDGTFLRNLLSEIIGWRSGLSQEILAKTILHVSRWARKVTERQDVLETAREIVRNNRDLFEF